jgi:hypothetical protein
MGSSSIGQALQICGIFLLRTLNKNCGTRVVPPFPFHSLRQPPHKNLKHLHHAREAIKGKVYAGVLGTDSTRDAGVNVAVVSQAEIDGDILDEEEEM